MCSFESPLFAPFRRSIRFKFLFSLSGFEKFMNMQGLCEKSYRTLGTSHWRRSYAPPFFRSLSIFCCFFIIIRSFVWLPWNFHNHKKKGRTGIEAPKPHLRVCLFLHVISRISGINKNLRLPMRSEKNEPEKNYIAAMTMWQIYKPLVYCSWK